MRIGIVIVALLTVMVSSCAEPNAKPAGVDGHEEIARARAENICGKNRRLDHVVTLALVHDPSIINAEGQIEKIDLQIWSDLSHNSDGSVSCETDIAILLSNAVTVGGLIRVTYADRNALDTTPDHPSDVLFKSDEVFLQEFLRKREAAGKKQEQEEIDGGYTLMRAADFDLDKRQLPADKKIALNGYYWRYRGAEVLTDQPPTTLTEFDGQPKVGLVTVDTPRETKNSMKACQFSVGHWCQVALVGHADNCEYTLNGQAAKADVCMFVDGSR